MTDPRHGQGAAVRAALDAAVSAGSPAPYLVVNADLPCVTARDLLALAGAIPENGLALAPAADGTTNALGLADESLFTPLYGPGSAERFAALGPSRLVEAPESRRRRRHDRRPAPPRPAARREHRLRARDAAR